MQSFLDLVKRRRSIREYKPAPVSDEDLAKIIEAGRLAPSWANKQCWRFIVVTDPARKKAMEPDREWIASAPAIIVVVADPAASGVKGDQQYYLLDVGMAVENILLAATDLGLVTHPMTGVNEDELKRVLGIPHEVRFVIATPLAYPAGGSYEQAAKERLSQRTRKDLEELVYSNVWGRRF